MVANAFRGENSQNASQPENNGKSCKFHFVQACFSGLSGDEENAAGFQFTLTQISLRHAHSFVTLQEKEQCLKLSKS